MICPAFTIDMRSLRLLCTLMLVLWARTLCLWTETCVGTGVVLSMSTLSAKRIEHMDCLPPQLMLTQYSMYGTDRCMTSLTTDLWGPCTSAHLEVGKNSSSCKRSNFRSDHTFWSHLRLPLLFAIFTIANYRYYVVPRINGSLCHNKIDKIVAL